MYGKIAMYGKILKLYKKLLDPYFHQEKVGVQIFGSGLLIENASEGRFSEFSTFSAV